MFSPEDDTVFVRRLVFGEIEMRKDYSAPKLERKGSLEALTQGQSSGTNVDALFVIEPGQPLPTFTFT